MAHGRDKYQSRERRARIRQILMEVWDPIGVQDVAEAQDEYEAYVGKVYVMLMQERASAPAIAAYLNAVAVDLMGLSPTPEDVATSTTAAAMIVELRPSFETH